MKLWAGLVTQLPKKSPIQQWILSRYVPEKGQKPMYWNLARISFAKRGGQHQASGVASGSQPVPHGADTRKGRLLESQKQFDQLAAQLEFLHWVVGDKKGPQFNFNDLNPKLRIDLSVVAANIASLFQ